MKTIQRAYNKKFYIGVKHHANRKDRVPYRTHGPLRAQLEADLSKKGGQQ